MPILKRKEYRSTRNVSRGHHYAKDPNAKEINLNRLIKPVYDKDPVFKEGEQFISRKALHSADIVKSFNELKTTSGFISKVKGIKNIKSEKGTIYYTFDDEKWLTEKEIDANYLPAFSVEKVWTVYLEVNKKLKDIAKAKEQEIFMAEKQQKIDNRKAGQEKAKLKKESGESSAVDKFNENFSNTEADKPKEKVKVKTVKKTTKKKSTKKTTKSKTTSPKKTK